ncbi:MAG: hypothetical protein SF053_16830 [Bacteroidia bacterium]|nr:hypothetical protein [Bacteroidia bacterium]
MAYYRIIEGVRYAADLLEAADQATQGKGESRISLQEIQAIHQLAMDGRMITDTERRTLLYIAQRYKLTARAKSWLQAQMQTTGGGDDIEQTITRVLRGDYGLRTITWQIDPAEVRQQEALGGKRLFGAALAGAVEAFLRWNQGQLSLSAFVFRYDLAFEGSPSPQDFLKTYLDQGTLFLIPTSPEARAELGYDFPDTLDFASSWLFGLHVPVFAPALFFASVSRTQPFQYSNGYFSRKAAPETLIHSIINRFTGFTRLNWVIDTAEVARQLALFLEQNFGNSLFAALHGGIFNGESSFSFRDFIQQEIWQDPDLDLRTYMRRYIDRGTLHLIPLDYRAQAAAGTASFPLPEHQSPWIEGDWVFGLEMPANTHVKVIITTPRQNSDGETGWNDGFIEDSLPLADRIGAVISGEFKLDGLNVVFSETEILSQQQQFGPDWRHFPGLVRQALNTVLDDYLTPRSVFSYVARQHEAEVSATHFDDPHEYRAAIRHLIRDYLKAGATLEFLPAELPDYNPIDGETTEDNWLFFVMIPALHPTGFWVVIPRWPDDGVLPYVYGDV